MAAKDTKLDKQLDQIVKSFESMQKIQQGQALQMNTISGHIEYIQKDIQGIQSSLKDNSGVFATKLELIDLEKEIISDITNAVQAVRAERDFENLKLRDEIKLPIKIVWTVASVVGMTVLGALMKLVILK